MLMELNLVWLMNLVHHPKNDVYKVATMRDLDNPARLLVLKNGTSNVYHAILDVSEEKFILNLCGKTIDKSKQWQEMLENTKQI